MGVLCTRGSSCLPDRNSSRLHTYTGVPLIALLSYEYEALHLPFSPEEFSTRCSNEWAATPQQTPLHPRHVDPSTPPLLAELRGGNAGATRDIRRGGDGVPLLLLEVATIWDAHIAPPSPSSAASSIAASSTPTPAWCEMAEKALHDFVVSGKLARRLRRARQRKTSQKRKPSKTPAATASANLSDDIPDASSLVFWDFFQVIARPLDLAPTELPSAYLLALLHLFFRLLPEPLLPLLCSRRLEPIFAGSTAAIGAHRETSRRGSTASAATTASSASLRQRTLHVVLRESLVRHRPAHFAVLRFALQLLWRHRWDLTGAEVEMLARAVVREDSLQHVVREVARSCKPEARLFWPVGNLSAEHSSTRDLESSTTSAVSTVTPTATKEAMLLSSAKVGGHDDVSDRSTNDSEDKAGEHPPTRDSGAEEVMAATVAGMMPPLEQSLSTLTGGRSASRRSSATGSKSHLEGRMALSGESSYTSTDALSSPSPGPTEQQSCARGAEPHSVPLPQPSLSLSPPAAPTVDAQDLLMPLLPPPHSTDPSDDGDDAEQSMRTPTAASPIAVKALPSSPRDGTAGSAIGCGVSTVEMAVPTPGTNTSDSLFLIGVSPVRKQHATSVMSFPEDGELAVAMQLPALQLLQRPPMLSVLGLSEEGKAAVSVSSVASLRAESPKSESLPSGGSQEKEQGRPASSPILTNGASSGGPSSAAPTIITATATSPATAAGEPGDAQSQAPLVLYSALQKNPRLTALMVAKQRFLAASPTCSAAEPLTVTGVAAPTYQPSIHRQEAYTPLPMSLPRDAAPAAALGSVVEMHNLTSSDQLLKDHPFAESSQPEVTTTADPVSAAAAVRSPLLPEYRRRHSTLVYQSSFDGSDEAGSGIIATISSARAAEHLRLQREAHYRRLDVTAGESVVQIPSIEPSSAYRRTAKEEHSVYSSNDGVLIEAAAPHYSSPQQRPPPPPLRDAAYVRRLETELHHLRTSLQSMQQVNREQNRQAALKSKGALAYCSAVEERQKEYENVLRRTQEQLAQMKREMSSLRSTAMAAQAQLQVAHETNDRLRDAIQGGSLLQRGMKRE